MNTRQEQDPEIAEIREVIVFLSEECRDQRQQENSAAVRDLSNHIMRLRKDLDALLEKRKKLITLAEAKKAVAKANDYVIQAVYEIVPDYAHLILQRQAELHLESEQPFEED